MFQEPTQNQKDEFQEFMLKLLKFTQDETDFNPFYCRQLIGRDGAYDAVISLVHSKSEQCGFEFFYARGRLKLTLEAVVVSDRWKHLFPEEIYKIARRRLKNYGYDIK